MVNKAKSSGTVYVGIGGWNFEPWRGVFYPDKLPQAKELNYAASKLTAIEINSTYYGSQKPETFRKWAARGAGRLPVLREGLTLLHQPPGAGRRRGLDQALPQFRRDRARRSAWPPAVAIRADQKFDERTSARSSNCCPRNRTV
jgi:hypothetical protein